MNAQSPPVRLVDVGHHYGSGLTQVDALTGINLHVRPGELLAVMGPSGSGKSTLLSIIGGLERPSEGSVYIHGFDISLLDAAARAEIRRTSIGYVFQDFTLITILTVLENVSLPLELGNMPPRAAQDAARSALESMGVLALADRFPEELSGAEQQKVAIARAFVGSRSVILADEPTGALDSHSAEIVMRALRLRVDSGVAGILATHEARFAAWADRTLFLRDGRIIDSSSPDCPEDLL